MGVKALDAAPRPTIPVDRHTTEAGVPPDAAPPGVDPPGVSAAFQVFGSQAPAHAAAWMQAAHALDEACALDAKTKDLAYLAVLAALQMETGIPFHVQLAKQHGASRDEVISAILLGLPPAGHGILRCLPAAIATYDSDA